MLILEQGHHEMQEVPQRRKDVKQAKDHSVREVAAQHGWTLKYVRDLLYEGKLQGAYKKDRVWRIPANAVEEWKQAREGRGDGTARVQR